MPSTQENNFLSEYVVLKLDNKELKINLYDTPLCKRWLVALEDNLKKKRILEKNFCWLGWADSKRDLAYLVSELNHNIEQINSFTFDPPYETIKKFENHDFHSKRAQYFLHLLFFYKLYLDPLNY